MKPKQKLVLATDSCDASGMGAHMLILGEGLSERFEVTMVMPRGCEGNLASKAFALGLAVKEFDDIVECGLWLKSVDADLIHVHAGIGWEGHGLAHAGKVAGVPVIRTEHLPFLLTEGEQKAAFCEGLGFVERLVVVSPRRGRLSRVRASIQTRSRLSETEFHRFAMASRCGLSGVPNDQTPLYRLRASHGRRTT